jgi:formamidopyrimidine-DNA glycosylase
MSGNLQIKPKDHVLAKHEHVTIVFANGLSLCYNDPRRFGAIIWTDKDPLQHELLKNLGPEPFNREFTAEYLFDRAKNRRIAVKQFIMASKVVVGIGNIYASEALFAAKINPLRRADSIALESYQLLVKKIKEILRSAIKNRGTTFRDHRDSQGKKGSFQNKLKVYGRQGQSCVDCKNKLEHIRIGQRATVFCPRCQR